MEKIKYQTIFSSTNKKVSCLGLGTVKFGRNTGVKYPNGEGAKLPSDAEIEILLDTALELGINVLDTAPAYGIAEERLGKLLKDRRKQFFLISKVGEEFDSKEIKSSYDFSSAHLNYSLERSLQRLNTDYLDCLMLHCNSEDYQTLTETAALETLQEFKNSGKILSIGVSIHSNEAGLLALKHCDALMVAYNSKFEKHLPVILAAAEENKTVLLKKAFMSGHLLPNETAENITAIMNNCPQAIIVAGTTNPERLKENVKIINSLC